MEQNVYLKYTASQSYVLVFQGRSFSPGPQCQFYAQFDISWYCLLKRFEDVKYGTESTRS